MIGAKLWTHSSRAQNGELDLHITATHLFPAEMSPTGVGFVLAVALTRPQSLGSVRLASRDPAVAPLIDLNSPRPKTARGCWKGSSWRAG